MLKLLSLVLAFALSSDLGQLAETPAADNLQASSSEEMKERQV